VQHAGWRFIASAVLIIASVKISNRRFLRFKISRGALLAIAVTLGGVGCGSHRAPEPVAVGAPTSGIDVRPSPGIASGSVPSGSRAAVPGDVTDQPASVGVSGTPLTLNNFSPPDYVAVLITTIHSHDTGSSSGAPAPGNGEYEVATINIDVRSGSYAFSPSRFKFLTPGGRTYTFEDGNGPVSGFGPVLRAGALSAGHRTIGTVTFDVPRGGGEVEYFGDAGFQSGGWTTPN
jgi:hypothetical protein